ncbi:MAG: antitoxin of toxin-antitoxin stability system [Synergistaceae bacterium]|jgi:DNA replicative helicase MCM subunit Mcm2 (Cdc46/Mcm family)|nr:antitoxin of toxin-antitoxin stability system [Synergistaceae bacterium]
MPEDAVFTMKLESELRRDFIAAADAVHRPASQVVQELMREFIQRQSEMEEYEEFLRRKIAIARSQIHTEQSYSNEEVESDFAKRRKKILQATGDVG